MWKHLCSQTVGSNPIVFLHSCLGWADDCPSLSLRFLMYNTGLTPVSVHAAGSICCNVSMEHLALLLESFAAVGICFPFSSKAEAGRSHPLSLSGQPLSPGSPASLSRCPSGDFADTGQAGAAGGGGLGKGRPKRMESWVGTLQRTSGRLLGLLKDEPEGRPGEVSTQGGGLWGGRSS